MKYVHVHIVLTVLLPREHSKKEICTFLMCGLLFVLTLLCIDSAVRAAKRVTEVELKFPKGDNESVLYCIVSYQK